MSGRGVRWIAPHIGQLLAVIEVRIGVDVGVGTGVGIGVEIGVPVGVGVAEGVGIFVELVPIAHN